MKSKHYSIQEPWNMSLDSAREDRRISARDFLYASEIGKNFLEVFWSMKGETPTNLATASSLRKMEAGNIYEAMISWVLEKCGVLKETQTRIRLLDNPKYLNVFGRADMIVGHDGNWEASKIALQDHFAMLDKISFRFPFFDRVKRTALATIDDLSKKYPEGLEDKIYEIKSINSLAFWRNDQPISKPYDNHVKQLSFYQYYHPTVKNGSFVYIDRDTMSISEIPNIVKDEVMKEIHDWIEKMTNYFRTNTRPPLPELVLFSEEENKWQYNWEVSRSQFKDKIFKEYGTDEGKIRAMVNEKNKVIRKGKALDDAVKGKDVRGIKKYKKAIEMLKMSIEDGDIIKKTGCTWDDLVKLKEKIGIQKLI